MLSTPWSLGRDIVTLDTEAQSREVLRLLKPARKPADSMTEFQCRVEKAIQPLNQSLTSNLSSSSHNG